MASSSRLSLAALALLSCALLRTPAAALTVRVESPDGAPRIVVNGQAVRTRMFFGGPGRAVLPVGPEWQSLDFEFTAVGGAENGTMHFRFGSGAGDVFLDDIQVTDLGAHRDLVPLCNFEGGQQNFDRDWTHWPTGAADTVGAITVEPKAGHDGTGGLHVKLTEPPDGQWPDFHIYHQPNLKIVAGHSYRVRLWAKALPARSLSIDFYRPGKTFVHLGGLPDPFISQIKLAAAAGVNFVSFPIGMPWPKPGEPVNWESTDAACLTVLGANPHALLIPRIPMNPPDWWRAAHPDEVMQWEDGRRALAVVASPLYRAEAAERLVALITHLEEQFGERIAGYHPDGQNTGEWFYEGTWNWPLNGYAPADLRAWRLWLERRYATDEALERAWQDPGARLETAAVPPPAARHAAPAGIFRDPATEQPIVDWAQFQQEAMADCVCELARAARAASKGRKLVLFFYGYVHELAAANDPATSGHYALRRVLNSPDIDILCSPISYFDRGLGGGAPSMSVAESAALAGKMWLNEDDTHTYLATGTPPGYRDHVTTLEATNAELTRNVAEEALRNFATWWMDLGATGWFDDAALWKQMTRLDALDAPLLKTPTPFQPEVAAVVDERSMFHVAAGGQVVTAPCVNEVRAPLGRMGAPYGQYLLDDVLAGKVHAKLYVFLDAWSLSAADRESLLRATRGSVCVWCYAPGYFEGDKTSLEAMKQLTGFRLQAVAGTNARATPAPAGRQAGLQQAFGIEQAVRPLFAAADARPEEILCTYPDGTPAVALRKGAAGEGASLFVGAPGLTSELLRFAARQAGVHLFTETDCNLYASGPFLALHASQDGPVKIDTGKPRPIVDLLSGETLGSGPQLTLPLHRGETRILRIAP